MLRRWKLTWFGFWVYMESDYLIGVVANCKVWDVFSGVKGTNTGYWLGL
jgi:hypothetical protein